MSISNNRLFDIDILIYLNNNNNLSTTNIVTLTVFHKIISTLQSVMAESPVWWIMDLKTEARFSKQQLDLTFAYFQLLSSTHSVTNKCSSA